MVDDIGGLFCKPDVTGVLGLEFQEAFGSCEYPQEGGEDLAYGGMDGPVPYLRTSVGFVPIESAMIPVGEV